LREAACAPAWAAIGRSASRRFRDAPRKRTNDVAKREDRIAFRLECTACKSPNYTTTKNKRNDPERMTLKKFCPRCRTHHEHRETKISGQG